MSREHRLLLTGPLDVPASLEPFRRSGDDGLDRWDGAVFLRALPVGGGRWSAIAARSVGTLERPELAVRVEPAGAASRALAALAATFVVAPADFARLAGRDAVIADLDARYPGLRPVLTPDLFTALIRAISAQQVNLRWAAETRRRLALAYGSPLTVGDGTLHRLDPQVLAGVPVAAVRALQFTTRKAEAIVALARAFATGDLDGADLAALPDDEVIDRLVALRGIGRWSAEWVLARTLGRPRVVAGDLGVRKAVARAYLGRPIADEPEIRAAVAHWGPSAVVAQTLLLRTLVEP